MPAGWPAWVGGGMGVEIYSSTCSDVVWRGLRLMRVRVVGWQSEVLGLFRTFARLPGIVFQRLFSASPFAFVPTF